MDGKGQKNDFAKHTRDDKRVRTISSVLSLYSFMFLSYRRHKFHLMRDTA